VIWPWWVGSDIRFSGGGIEVAAEWKCGECWEVTYEGSKRKLGVMGGFDIVGDRS